MFRRAGVPGASILGPLGGSGIVAIGLLLSGFWPAGPADASGFYTRKRVNGVWITGQFPREGGEATSRRKRVAAAATPADDETPPLPPIPDELGVVRIPSAVVEESVTTTAALPASLMPDEAGGAQPLDERLSRLKDALTAKASDLVASVTAPLAATLPSVSSAAQGPSPVAPAVPGLAPTPTGAPSASASPPEAMAAPAVAPVSAAPVVASVKAAAPRLDPKSVSYDFDTGIKTTVYENSTVREPFDAAAMRAAASRAASR